MESSDADPNDQILYASGISPQDCVKLSVKEKESIASAVKASQRDANSSSSSSSPILNNPAKEEVPTRTSQRIMNNAAVGTNTNKPGARKTGNKPVVPGTAVPVKDNLNSRATSGLYIRPKLSEQITEGSQNSNEAGGVAKKAPVSRDEENIQSCDEESVKSPGSNSDARVADSPDTVEEDLIPSLMQIVFEKQKCASRLPESVYPPFTLSKSDWVQQMGQYLFERKVSKIRQETRGSKWVTIYEKTYPLSAFERIIARSPIAKEDSPSPVESRNVTEDDTNKEKAFPIYANNLRENSPDISNSPERKRQNSPEKVFVTGPSNRISSSSVEQPEVTSTSGTLKKSGMENLSERNEDDVNNEIDNQGRQRNRRKKNARHKQTADLQENSRQRYQGESGRQRNQIRSVGSNVNSPSHDDALKSDYEFSNSAEKEPYAHNNADYPPLNGTGNTDNHTAPLPLPPAEMGDCPLCNKFFPTDQLNDHAWNCDVIRSTEEETKQMAAKEENGSDSDVMEVETGSEEKKLFPSDGENQSDGCSRSSARIRSMKRSGGNWLSKGERPTKSLRK